MLKIVKHFFPKRKSPHPSAIIIGIDYLQHQIGDWLQSQGWELSCFIDDEPWNHKTKMLGAPLHYPSELVALIKKHQVRLVIQIKNSGPELMPHLLEELEQTTTLITLDASVTVNDALEQLKRAL